VSNTDERSLTGAERGARTARRATAVAEQSSAVELALTTALEDADGTALEEATTEALEATAVELGTAGADELATAEAELETTGTDEAEMMGAELEAMAELVGSGSSEQPSSEELATGADDTAEALATALEEMTGAEVGTTGTDETTEDGATLTTEEIATGEEEATGMLLMTEETTPEEATGTLLMADETTPDETAGTLLMADDTTGALPEAIALDVATGALTLADRPLEVGRGRHEAGFETTADEEATAEEETIADDEITGADEAIADDETAADDAGTRTGLLDRDTLTEGAATLVAILGEALEIADVPGGTMALELALAETATDEADAGAELAGSPVLEGAGAAELAEEEPEPGRLYGSSFVASAQKAMSMLILSSWHAT